MFKRIMLIVILIFIFVFTFSHKLKANSEYEIKYYFDNLLSDKTYYYEVDSNSYPVFEGYTFKDEIKEGKQINLYYVIKELKVIINGNGGLYEGLDEVVVKTINYGETYFHNPVEINKYIFKNEGFILESFERSFDRELIATDDIIYYAKWNRQEFDYEFHINNEKILVKQRVDDYLNLPEIIDHKNFLGFYDEDDTYYNSDYLIESNETLKLYAKYENHIDYLLYSDMIAIYSYNHPWLLKGDSGDINGEYINNYYVFKGLSSNTAYTFENLDNNLSVNLTTKESDYHNHYAYNYEGEIYILSSNNYTYYSEHKELITSNKFKYIDGIKYQDKFSDKTIKDLLVTDLTSIDEYEFDYEFNNYLISFDSNSIDDLFLINDNYEQVSNNQLKINNIITDKDYYIIIFTDSKYYYKEFKLDDPNINIKVYGTKTIIENNSGYQYTFNNEKHTELNLEFNNLQPYTKYNIEYELNGIIFKKYFYTNSLVSNIENIDFDLTISDNQIIINNPYKNYGYGLIIKDGSVSNINWKDINNETVDFFNLLSNTEYDLYIRSYINNDYFKVKVINTKKSTSNNVVMPLPMTRVIDVEEDHIVLFNNVELEYSLDTIKWYSTDEEELTLSNLTSFMNYEIYIRNKETQYNEASKYVLSGKFKTLAKSPSKDSLIDLYFDYKKVSFTLLNGYNYYFNNKLITNSEFIIDNLELNSSHNIRIERISDGKTFEHIIKLKTISKLSDDEKMVLISKSDEKININHSNEKLTYIIKFNNEIIGSITGNNDLITFRVENDKVYQLYILKKSTNNEVYMTEYIEDIYMPPNIKKMFDSYLLNNKYANHKKILEIIDEQTIHAYTLNSSAEFDALYASGTQLIDEAINEISEQRKTTIYIRIITTSIILISAVSLVYLRRKKVRT